MMHQGERIFLMAIRSSTISLNKIANSLSSIDRTLRHAFPKAPVNQASGFKFSLELSLKPENTMPVEVSLSTEERVRVTAAPVTKSGKPAKLDGAVSFSSDNPDVVIETIDDTSAFINSPETPGDSVVVVSADADVGEGVTTIQDTVLLHVADPQASSLGLSAGTPEPKTPTA